MITRITMLHQFEVINLDNDVSHGTYETLEEAQGCVTFDDIKRAKIVDTLDPYAVPFTTE